MSINLYEDAYIIGAIYFTKGRLSIQSKRFFLFQVHSQTHIEQYFKKYLGALSRGHLKM